MRTKKQERKKHAIGFIGDVQVELGRCIGTLEGIANALEDLEKEGGSTGATIEALIMLARQRVQSSSDVMRIYETLLEE